jgi:hypothetical protein
MNSLLFFILSPTCFGVLFAPILRSTTAAYSHRCVYLLWQYILLKTASRDETWYCNNVMAMQIITYAIMHPVSCCTIFFTAIILYISARAQRPRVPENTCIYFHLPNHGNYFCSRTVFFWVITQRIVAISYRRCGATYRSHLQSCSLKIGPIRCPETSVRNCHYSLRNNAVKRLSVPSSWPRRWDQHRFYLNVGKNYHYSLRSDPEMRSFQSLGDGSLKSRNFCSSLNGLQTCNVPLVWDNLMF